jgi:hypothetical protein
VIGRGVAAYDGRMRFVALLVAASVQLTIGCSTSYVPQSRGRVSVVIENGTWAYARDGETFRHGFLGSGLMRAVRGNPRAEAAAKEYHDRQRDGLLITLGGLVCSTVTMAYAVREIDRSENNNEVPTELWVSLGCLLASLTVGPIYIASAEPYRWDAINIFNDGPPPMPYGPPGAPGAPGYGVLSTKKKLSLKMSD